MCLKEVKEQESAKEEHESKIVSHVLCRTGPQGKACCLAAAQPRQPLSE
jgi:hypothetical protein